MQVTIKVAVIGPRELVNRVLEAGLQFAELDLLAFPYGHENETMRLAKTADEQVKVILFTGPVPYMIASQSGHPFQAELLHVNYVGTGLYRVFFQMLRDGLLVDGHRISVDFLLKADVLEAVTELEFSDMQFAILELTPSVTPSEIFEFHSNQWHMGRVDAIITCLFSIYERLSREGIPAYCVLPTGSSIQYALRSAVEQGRLKQLRNNQVAACMVSATSGGEGLCSAMADWLNTEGQSLGNNRYLFYTTRGFISALTDGYDKPFHFPHLNQDGVAVGIGIGKTPKEASGKSYEAYLQSKSEQVGSVYIVDDDNSIVRLNPVTHANLEYTNRTYDDSLRTIAANTNLSVSTLSKMQFVIRTTGDYTLTAAELARHLDVTLRSARRILKALADAGYAAVVGEEQPITRGRPRNVYKIAL